MTPIFISAKTNKCTDAGWIYEIRSVADHFSAVPVMTILQDCDHTNIPAFTTRAAQMGVSLLGAETIWDKKRLRKAFEQVSHGRLVKPHQSKQKELSKDEI